jgi:threonine efflux protein
VAIKLLGRRSRGNVSLTGRSEKRDLAEVVQQFQILQQNSDLNPLAARLREEGDRSQLLKLSPGADAETTMDTAVLTNFLLLWLVIVPTPGANSLMVTHQALTRPAGHVALAILGNVAGVLLLATCAMLGWAAALETFPWLRLAVNVLGGCYLIYFGWRLLMRARSAPPTSVSVTGTVDHRLPTEPLKAVGLGVVTALSNAQAILFITSIFAVSGVLNADLPTSLGVLGIIAVCNITYLGFLGWMFQRDSVRRGYQSFRRPFEGIIGAVFVGFGGRLI